MFAVIYRFKLKPYQELDYQKCWHVVAEYFIEQCGALGSCLHKGSDNLWVAYSRWPDQATRDQFWTADSDVNAKYPKVVYDAIQKMRAIKEENRNLEQYDEIRLAVVEDLL